MKKLCYSIIVTAVLSFMFQGCNLRNGTDVEINGTEGRITEEMAYKAIYNYCHSEYDWSIAEDNPSIMYLEMGEETKSEYKVIFRSYTGAFMYFYVDKSNGTIRIIEHVPTLNIENEAGTINLYDYLEESNLVK